MSGDKDHPLPIHPFDLFRIMHEKNDRQPWFWKQDWKEYPDNVFEIDGIFYVQTTEVPASEEAKKLIA